MRIRFRAYTSTIKHFSDKQMLETIAIRNLIMLMSGYIFSWLPYAVVSLNIYFDVIKSGETSAYLTLVASLFAKLSFIWIPTFYLLTNKNLRIKQTEQL